MTKITKAVVAAGGWGTRFFPAVKSMSKQMVPIIDKPAIQVVVEELIGAGLTDINIVHREGDSSMQDYFKLDPNLLKYLDETGKRERIKSLEEVLESATIQFTPQTSDLPYGNASPVLATKEFIGQDPFAYIFADDSTLEEKPGDYVSHMIRVFEEHSPAVVLSAEHFPGDAISTVGSIKYKEGSTIPNQAEQIIEKPEPSEAPSEWGQSGRFICDGKRVLDVLENQKTSKGNELWFTDTNNYLAEHDVVIAEKMPKEIGRRITTGDPANWLICNIEFAKKRPEVWSKIKEYLEK